MKWFCDLYVNEKLEVYIRAMSMYAAKLASARLQCITCVMCDMKWEFKYKLEMENGCNERETH